MKILCITRLFSGLETSLLNQEWQPTGVPTIFKMFEKFDRDAEVRFVLTQKDGHTLWHENRIKKLNLKGMNNPFIVLPSVHAFYKIFPNKLRKAFREIFHLVYAIIFCLRFNPDLLYIDHANTFSAAVLKKFFGRRVVYRVMGVYPAMRNALSGKRFVDKLFASCYHQPYDLIVCTQDGSGIEPWLRDATNKQTPKHSLINGVDLKDVKPATESLLPVQANERFKILFVGKIEHAKGAPEFFKAFKRCHELKPGYFHAVMVGSGSLAKQIREDLAKNNLEEFFTMIEKLPHAKILQMHMQTDAYISLNRLGSLSVANLEALKIGQCTLVPQSQPEIGIDLFTDSFVPQECIVKYSRPDNTEEIAQQIIQLEGDREKVKKMKAGIFEWAQTNIPSWPERVEREWSLLTNLYNNG